MSTFTIRSAHGDQDCLLRFEALLREYSALLRARAMPAQDVDWMLHRAAKEKDAPADYLPATSRVH